MKSRSFPCKLHGEKSLFGVFEIIFQGLEKFYGKLWKLVDNFPPKNFIHHTYGFDDPNTPPKCAAFKQFVLVFLVKINTIGLVEYLGLVEQKMFKRVWQVVETILFASKITFFVETCENFEYLISFRILLVQVEENYTKNNDLQYFSFQIKIANAILHADKVLQRRGALRDSL